MSTINETIQAKNERIKGQIMHLLRWDEDTFLNFKMRCGCSFAQEYMPQNPALIDELALNRLFWAWWLNQWLLRDEALLLNEDFHSFSRNLKELYYKWLHSPDNLLKVMTVDSIIFENTSISQKPTRP